MRLLLCVNFKGGDWLDMVVELRVQYLDKDIKIYLKPTKRFLSFTISTQKNVTKFFYSKLLFLKIEHISQKKFAMKSIVESIMSSSSLYIEFFIHYILVRIFLKGSLNVVFG